MQFRVEAFNVTNTAAFMNPTADAVERPRPSGLNSHGRGIGEALLP